MRGGGALLRLTTLLLRRRQPRALVGDALRDRLGLAPRQLRLRRRRRRSLAPPRAARPPRSAAASASSASRFAVSPPRAAPATSTSLRTAATADASASDADGASEASRESPRDDSGSDGVDATDSVGEPSALLLLRTPRTCTLRRSESSAAVERARLPNLTTRRGESSCGDVSESRGGVGGSEMRSLLPGL